MDQYRMRNYYLGASLPELFFSNSPVTNKGGQTAVSNRRTVPDVEACRALWDKYSVPEHIRQHCINVAEIAESIAKLACSHGVDISLNETYAAGLLHDIGKNYCILHGGSHAQLGAAWIVKETSNQRIGQAILHHVHWPFHPNVYEDSWLLGLIIVYADKRVKHDQKVSLEERFADLLARYGKTQEINERINSSHEQGLYLENALSQRFGVKLNECSFDSGRLV